MILLSGGIESTTLLHQEHGAGTRLWPLFVDYGQRAARRERHCAQAQCDALGIPLKIFDISAVGETLRADSERKLHVPLPHRNLPILALAASYAGHRGANRLYLALNREDLSAYPSAGTGFLERFDQMLKTLGPLQADAPLKHLGKTDIIRHGLALGVDYAKSYSCLLGYELQCGGCPQCVKRREAFAGAGVQDPAGYRDRAAPRS